MCAGGLYWAQLGKLIYAVADPKRGYQRMQENLLHPKTKVVSGVLESECQALLNTFFARLRKQR